MSGTVYCPCGKMFEVPRQQAGGIVNCPGCGKAVEVPGLNDPLWRLLQGIALLAIVAVTVLTSRVAGLPTGIASGAGVAAAIYLVSRAF